MFLFPGIALQATKMHTLLIIVLLPILIQILQQLLFLHLLLAGANLGESSSYTQLQLLDHKLAQTRLRRAPFKGVTGLAGGLYRVSFKLSDNDRARNNFKSKLLAHGNEYQILTSSPRLLLVSAHTCKVEVVLMHSCDQHRFRAYRPLG